MIYSVKMRNGANKNVVWWDLVEADSLANAVELMGLIHMEHVVEEASTTVYEKFHAKGGEVVVNEYDVTNDE